VGDGTGNAVLALDLGTTGVCALVVAADGAVRGRAWRPLAAQFSMPGRFEQDPQEWWARSVEVLAEALARAELTASDVAAIGVVSQRSTAVAWDASTGAPLAPAIGWQDARTAPRVAQLQAQGIPINTLASATKFEWLLAQEPALAAAARSGRLRLGTPDAWLTDRLTGGDAFATDPGQASCTGLWELAGERWHPAALALFGIDPDWLPRVAASSGVLGVTPAALLGHSVPVASRAGDQQAATFAQGAHAPGMAKLTLGTSAMADVHTGAAPAAAARGSYPLALWTLADGTRAFCVEATVITAGAALDWLVDLGLLATAAEADAVARSVPSAEGVRFVPALQGLGSPFLSAEARGLWSGLGRATRPAHLVRAVLDGIAQRCADLCDALPLRDEPLRVDGGLARSDVLLHAIADATGRSLLRANELETTALGAAWLAGLATGVWSDPAAVADTAAPATRVDPGVDGATRAERRASWRRELEHVQTSAFSGVRDGARKRDTGRD
jgi:glycerol kinase